MKKIRYILYARKSTESDEKQVLSIESQIEEAKRKFRNLDIVDVIEERHSAFRPSNRPAFDEMIQKIKDGEAEGIVAWHPDRLSRNEIDAATITYMIRTGQIKDLRFGSYYFDNSPEGIMFLQYALSQSQYSSAKLSKDATRGLLKKAKMGWRPGLPSQGYINHLDKIKGYSIIVKDKERLPLIRKMFDLLFSGAYTPPKILDIANDEWGYRTMKRRKSGGRPLSRSGIYKIFTNPFYCGWFEYPEGSGQWYKGKHKPIITEEEFDQAQIILGRKGKPRPKKHAFAFTGVIRCGECGCLITAETKKKLIKSTNKVRKYIYYHCTKKKRHIKCSQRSIKAEDLKLQIENEIESLTILPEFRSWAIRALDSNGDPQMENCQKVYEMQSKSLVKMNKELSNLVIMRRRDLIDDETFIAQREDLEIKISKLKEKRNDSERRAEQNIKLMEETFEFATYARQKFICGGLETKKEILLKLGQNFILKDKKLQIANKEWLVPIKEGYPALQKVYLGLELNKKPLNKVKREALASIRSRWLGR